MIALHTAIEFDILHQHKHPFFQDFPSPAELAGLGKANAFGDLGLIELVVGWHWSEAR